MPHRNKPMYQMKAIDKTRAEITIYTDISEYWGDVNPRQFKSELDAIGDVKFIDIRINSSGGNVTSGYAIYNQLKQHKAFKTAFVDGIAASMAAFILMAADKICMSIAGLIMIHNPWGWAIGEAHELRAQAEILDQMAKIAVDVHSERTGTSKKEVKKMMEKTTYLTSDEALEKGFIDEIITYDDENEKPELDTENMMLYIAGQQMNMSQFNQSNAFMQKANVLIGRGYMKLKNKDNQLEGDDEVKTLEELKQQKPDLYQQAVEIGKQEGINTERARMKAIDDVALDGTEEIVAKMKYEDPRSAAEAAVEIVNSFKQSAKPQPTTTPPASQETTGANMQTVTNSQSSETVAAGAAMLNTMQQDSAQGASLVPGSQGELNQHEQKMQRANRIANAMNGGQA